MVTRPKSIVLFVVSNIGLTIFSSNSDITAPFAIDVTAPETPVTMPDSPEMPLDTAETSCVTVCDIVETSLETFLILLFNIFARPLSNSSKFEI